MTEYLNPGHSILLFSYVFLVILYGLKGMVDAPVVGLKTRGALFPDDLVYGPFYGLPVNLCMYAELRELSCKDTR